jgi:hypothetical protein
MRSKNSLIISWGGRMTALALYLLTGSLAQSQINFGISSGFAGPVGPEAIPDFSEDVFQRTKAYAASMGYRFGSGATIGVRYEQLRMRLTEGSDALGTLDLRPAMVSAGYQSRPDDGRGFAGHGQGGGGIARTKFVKGSAVRALETFYGATVLVSTKTAPVFEFGGGVDYFITKRLSITSDFRVVVANVNTDWSVGSAGFVVPIEGIDKFLASTWQVLGGIRFYLW